jgi:hypothetical protein
MGVRGILQRWRGHVEPPVQGLSTETATLPAHPPIVKKRFVMAGLDPAVSVVHAKLIPDPSDPI